MADIGIPSPTYIRTFFGLIWRAFAAYRVQFVVLILLGFLSGILEGVGVTTFVPLLNFELTSGAPGEDTISNFISKIFSFLHVPFVPKYLLLFIVLLFIGKAAVGVLLDYLRVRMNADFEQRTRDELFSAQLRASWPYLLRQRLGVLETLILVDVTACRELLARMTVSIMYLTNIAMYLIVVLNASASITLLTLVIGILFMFVFRPVAVRIHAISSARSKLQYAVTHHVGEHLSGMKTVKTFAVEQAAIERGSHFFQLLKRYSISIDMLRVISVAIVQPLAVVYVAIVFVLAFRFHLVAIAALPTVVYLIYRIFSYGQQLTDSLQMINASFPYLRNVLDYKKKAEHGKEESSGNAPFSLQKEIRYDHVHFSYDRGTNVLNDVSFTIPRGNMLGIIGPSGSGKTTCVDLLLRLLKAPNGSITIDGVPIESVSMASWRRSIAYVSQDLFLIHGTIRDNIRFYDNSVSDEMIWEAARLAHIDEFIRQRPEGLDAEVGERGIELSAGQRQRLVIARALVRKPEVLVLDEATSALDAESEAHIQRMFSELKGKVTIVAIAHRLTTIAKADALIVLMGGRIVESGKPHELLQNDDSYFYRVSTITA